MITVQKTLYTHIRYTLLMPYKKDGYTLFTREVKLRGGKKQSIYYFSKKLPKSGSPCEMPDGYAVGVNKRTGLPYLKKK